jgi:hypothetical protein
MENSSRLYNTVVKILCQHENWLDMRHLYTLAWMMVGLILSESINLTAWVPYVLSRAKYAQSTVRRFQRWLNNPRIQVHRLYAPLIKKALAGWGEYKLYLALDTSTLWDNYCIIRITVVYRGRAIPIVWKVLEHKSSNVSYENYKPLLDAVPAVLPTNVVVVFLADRGFADISLMSHVKKLGWHFRIRIKKNFWIYQDGCNPYQVGNLPLRPGECIFLQNVYITADKYGPVYLSLAHHSDNGELWYVASDEHTDTNTFLEYGMRFDIEENFLDDKSNGFQLESSFIRSSDALSRLCFVLSMSTLYLVSQGTQVVSGKKRRWVDPHWFRGNSYLRIGWQWIKSALVHGWALCTVLCLNGQPDPEPVIASLRQANKKTAISLKMLYYNDSA